MGQKIYIKYCSHKTTLLRWALKPVFISFLLQKEIEKVIYCDSDIFFVNDFSFLFNELSQYSVLLTPHIINPVQPGRDNLVSLAGILKGGYFNAGFIGANKSALPMLDWWAEMCSAMMGKNPETGIMDDQRYLDIAPYLFEGIKIIRHPGCNIAVWNTDYHKREMYNGKLKINKTFDPVFIHFTYSTTDQIIKLNDKLLLPYLKEFLVLSNYSDNKDKFTNLAVFYEPSRFLKLKHKIRLRTRIKKFLLYIYQKL